MLASKDTSLARTQLHGYALITRVLSRRDTCQQSWRSVAGPGARRLFRGAALAAARAAVSTSLIVSHVLCVRCVCGCGTVLSRWRICQVDLLGVLCLLCLRSLSRGVSQCRSEWAWLSLIASTRTQRRTVARLAWTTKWLLNKLLRSSGKCHCTKFHPDRALPATRAVCIWSPPLPALAPCHQRTWTASTAERGRPCTVSLLIVSVLTALLIHIAVVELRRMASLRSHLHGAIESGIPWRARRASAHGPSLRRAIRYLPSTCRAARTGRRARL